MFHLPDRSILGMEESGKAIAVHERRLQMTSAPGGSIQVRVLGQVVAVTDACSG